YAAGVKCRFDRERESTEISTKGQFGTNGTNGREMPEPAESREIITRSPKAIGTRGTKGHEPAEKGQ
ncbi:hypothetical protein KI387_033058, partial [Taxus chinensis]